MVDTLSFWLLLCQKTTKGLWFYILIESSVHNLSHFFLHNINQSLIQTQVYQKFGKNVGKFRSKLFKSGMRRKASKMKFIFGSENLSIWMQLYNGFWPIVDSAGSYSLFKDDISYKLRDVFNCYSAIWTRGSSIYNVILLSVNLRSKFQSFHLNQKRTIFFCLAAKMSQLKK